MIDLWMFTCNCICQTCNKHVYMFVFIHVPNIVYMLTLQGFPMRVLVVLYREFTLPPPSIPSPSLLPLPSSPLLSSLPSSLPLSFTPSSHIFVPPPSLLLQDLCQHTPEDHKDYSVLRQSLHAMSAFIASTHDPQSFSKVIRQTL